MLFGAQQKRMGGKETGVSATKIARRARSNFSNARTSIKK
jgi:hypothetical protein